MREKMHKIQKINTKMKNVFTHLFFNVNRFLNAASTRPRLLSGSL